MNFPREMDSLAILWGVLIRSGGVILFFAIAAISLGNDRVRRFRRYLNSFKKQIDVPK
jgi:hypothetical protein